MNLSGRLKHLEKHRDKLAKGHFCPNCGELFRGPKFQLSIEQHVERFRNWGAPLLPGFLDWLRRARPELAQHIGEDDVYRGPSLNPTFAAEIEHANYLAKTTQERPCSFCGRVPIHTLTLEEIKEDWRRRGARVAIGQMPPQIQRIARARPDFLEGFLLE
jgi:hypothetical protein